MKTRGYSRKPARIANGICMPGKRNPRPKGSREIRIEGPKTGNSMFFGLLRVGFIRGSRRHKGSDQCRAKADEKTNRNTKQAPVIRIHTRAIIVERRDMATKS